MHEADQNISKCIPLCLFAVKGEAISLCHLQEQQHSPPLERNRPHPGGQIFTSLKDEVNPEF